MSSELDAAQFEDPPTDKESNHVAHPASSLQEGSTIKIVKAGGGKSNLVHLNPGLKSTQRKVRSVLRSNAGWMSKSRGGTQQLRDVRDKLRIEGRQSAFQEYANSHNDSSLISKSKIVKQNSFQPYQPDSGSGFYAVHSQKLFVQDKDDSSSNMPLTQQKRVASIPPPNKTERIYNSFAKKAVQKAKRKLNATDTS